MSKKRKHVAFVWQGFSGRYGFWNDGLQLAMKRLEEKYKVTYHEPWDTKVGEADIILYWEAPVTARGGNAQHYNRIRRYDKPKALLFAGGPINREDIEGFDLFFVESEINEREFSEFGKPWIRAFGVNEEVMKPMNYKKEYDGIIQATFADWKRHDLFAEALGDKGLAVGRIQDHDRNGYNRCVELGVHIEDELPHGEVAKLINKSHVVLNTSSYWGGGQRCTLEGMACGVPVIVMSDSPKNREYVEESGAGLVVDPDPQQIREAIENIKKWSAKDKKRGYDYVRGKWTSKHYSKALEKGIEQL